MPNLLKFKRGTAATLPVGSAAEPLFTTDTYDLYIGKGNGSNQRFQKYIASGTSSQFLKGDGSLDSTSYQTALTFSSPLVNTSGTISIPAATGSVNGYLTSTDWTTFNSKEPAITAGTSLQYYRGDKTFQTLNTSVVPESGAVYFTEPRVLATVLTGLNLSGGGTIAATDSVLTAFGKVQNQISALVGGATYQGVWNASTNSPSLASGVGTKGYYYVVSVAGSTNLDGITDWKVGDWAIFNGTTWDKVDNTDAVSSVNGFTGAVNLGLGDISNVTLSSPTNGQLLQFNGTSSKWVNWTPTYISGNQTITLSGDVSGSGATAITTTIGALKVTNAMLAGTIDYAKMDATTVPTWNQNTTGSAATLTTARTLTIGSTGKTFNGSANVSWSLAEIGAFANPMTTLGDIIYGGASGAATRLAGNTVASKRFLIQTGDGTNSAAPSWGSIAAADVPTLNQNTTGTAANITATSNSTITTLSSLSLPYSQLTGTPALNYLPLSGGTLTGALSGTSATFSTEVTSSGSQGRFGGWSTGAGYQGAALEAGVSGGTATLIGYNRTTSVYIPLTIGGNTNQTTTIGGNTIVLQNNGVTALSIASTGAATFSGALTGTSATFSATYSAGGTVNIMQWQRSGGAVAADMTYNDANTSMNFGTSTAHALNLKTGGTTALSISSTGAATFSSSVTATGGFEIPNGQFYRARRTSGSLLTDMIGIPSGSDDVRILTTGDFNIINGSITNILTVKNGGNVGIGTTSPSYLLDVQTSSVTQARFRGSSTDAAIIRLENSTSTQTYGIGAAGSANLGGAPNNSFYIRDETANAVRLAITSGGNVGIGVTSTVGKLDIATGGNTNIVISNDATDTGYNIVSLNGTRTKGSYAGIAGGGTGDNRLYLNSGDAVVIQTGASYTERMRITSGGNVAIGNTVGNTELHIHSSDTDTRIQITNSSTGTGTNTGLALAQQSDNTYIYNYQNGPMIFGTYGTERMRISATGELWIAGTTDQGAYNLQCNGTGVWGAGAYVNGSDIALKDNINDIGSTIEIIKKLKPKTFNYKNWYSKDQDIQTGFIAQELEEVLYDQLYLKGIVKSGKKYKNVAYQNIIPLLVKAIQEQQIEIDNLKSK